MLSYNNILDHFWVNIDPFDDRGQFCDRGPSYLSAIFVANDKERAMAEKTKADVVAQLPNKKVVTPILDASTFYPIMTIKIFIKKVPFAISSTDGTVDVTSA